MGGVSATFSKNTVDILNKTVNSISSKSTHNCTNNMMNNQKMTFNIGKIYGCSLRIGANQNITANINSDCKQINVTKQELKTAFTNAVDQLAQTLLEAGSLSVANVQNSENITKLRNVVENQLNYESIANTINANVANQSTAVNIDEIHCFPMKIKDVWGNEKVSGDSINLDNFSQTIMSNAIFKSVQDNQTLMNAITSVDNQISQEASNTSRGLGHLLSMSPVMGVVLVIFILCFFVLGPMIGGKSKIGSSSGGSSGGAIINADFKNILNQVQKLNMSSVNSQLTEAAIVMCAKLGQTTFEGIKKTKKGVCSFLLILVVLSLILNICTVALLVEWKIVQNAKFITMVVFQSIFTLVCVIPSLMLIIVASFAGASPPPGMQKILLYTPVILAVVVISFLLSLILGCLFLKQAPEYRDNFLDSAENNKRT